MLAAPHLDHDPTNNAGYGRRQSLTMRKAIGDLFSGLYPENNNVFYLT